MIFKLSSYRFKDRLGLGGLARTHVNEYLDDTQSPGFILNKETDQGGEAYSALFSYFFGKLLFFNGDF